MASRGDRCWNCDTTAVGEPPIASERRSLRESTGHVLEARARRFDDSARRNRQPARATDLEGDVGMAHTKCARCSARVWIDGPAVDPPLDLCPGCGDPLEAMGNLSELVGLRSLGTRPKRPSGSAGAGPGRISELIRAKIALNDAERRRRIDAEPA